jgi:hypothetical protein
MGNEVRRTPWSMRQEVDNVNIEVNIIFIEEPQRITQRRLRRVEFGVLIEMW